MLPGSDDQRNVQMAEDLLMTALRQVAESIAQMQGSNCEVVLHDLSQPTASVVHVVNGHVTGRQVGQGIRDLLGIVQSPRFHDDRLVNYLTRTTDGRTIRSSTMIFRDHNQELAAAICINQEITALVTARNLLNDLCTVHDKGAPETPAEDGVESMVRQIIMQTIQGYGIPIHRMSKEDKLAVIRFLDDKGAFLVKGALERVAAELHISRSSIYKYLDEIRLRRLDHAREDSGFQSVPL